MKKYLSTIAITLLGLTGLTACSGDDPDGTPTKDRLEVSPAVVVDYNASETSINVTANCHWTASLSEAWQGFTIETREGNGNGTVRIVTGTNSQTTARQATVVIESESGIITKTVSVEQTAGPIILNVSQQTVSAEAEGGVYEIGITCNTEWTVSGGSDGITYDVPSGTGNGSMRIMVSENMYETPREATITVQAGTEERQIAISQKGKEVYLSASPTSILASAAGGTYQITVNSNAAWRVTGGSSWAQPDNTEGEGNGAVTLGIEPNLEPYQRGTSIVIEAGSHSYTVTVEQQPGSVPEIGGSTGAGLQISDITKYGARATFSYSSSATVVEQYGVCISTTNPTPTVNDLVFSQTGNTTVGEASITLSGLESGTVYYVRAFAVNATGTAYSEPQQFTTLGSAPGEDDNPLPNLVRRRQ